jgi:hypothetical protein
MSISSDSTIVAAVVSAIISVSILLVSSYIIQPRRIRQSWNKENLEKQLAVYGALTTMLDTFHAKSTRQPTNDPKVLEVNPFEMDIPYDSERLSALIENKSYLFSKEISELWFKRVGNDKFNDLSPNARLPTILLDLTELQTCANKEYAALKIEYTRLTGIKLPN